MGYQEWRTPRWFFNQLDAEFHFTVDVAATKENALCDRYYTKESDGLIHDWSDEVVWCNPPYANVAPWVQRASRATLRRATCVLLLNVCTDTNWFHDYIWDTDNQDTRPNVEMRLYRGRLVFLDEYGLPGTAPRHPNMVVIFRPSSPVSPYREF